MIGTFLRGGRPRHGLRLFSACCVVYAFITVMLAVTPAAAQSPPYANGGLRWIGSRSTTTTTSCKGPTNWNAKQLFVSPTLPGGLLNLCLYTWAPTSQPPRPPVPQDIAILASSSLVAPDSLTEDVPVLYPSAPFSTEEVAFFAGLGAALRTQVGNASLLQPLPQIPAARIVVIDSAPDASHGLIHPGVSRHGDTLAHLIEDIVCLPMVSGQARKCAAEVTTVLALPLLSHTGVVGPNGGYIGTLADLASAIDRAVNQWQTDRNHPRRLVLNLSLGWEHLAGVADCSTAPLKPSAQVVRDILQAVVSEDVLIVAAAGNDSGGPVHRTGLVCPARYQAVRQDRDPSQSLLVAVSGVDYQDRPLRTVRPAGTTGIVGLGLGGAGWTPGDPVPPQLIGSSVSTAVVSAVSALVWAAQPNWTPRQITKAVYNGGVLADRGLKPECPLLLSHCVSRRASVCGALKAAGVVTSTGAPLSCEPTPRRSYSSPTLAGEIANLNSAFASLSNRKTGLWEIGAASLPSDSFQGVQIQPWTFPMPVAETCGPCRLAAGQLYIPAREQDLVNPILVVVDANDAERRVTLRPPGSVPSDPSPTLDKVVPYSFDLSTLPDLGTVVSAYISAYGPLGPGGQPPSYSIEEQIFVQQ